jgi:hypothetical protein
VAALDHAPSILAVFDEVASEIPIRDTQKKQELMEVVTGEGIDSGNHGLLLKLPAQLSVLCLRGGILMTSMRLSCLTWG